MFMPFYYYLDRTCTFVLVGLGRAGFKRKNDEMYMYIKYDWTWKVCRFLITLYYLYFNFVLRTNFQKEPFLANDVTLVTSYGYCCNLKSQRCPAVHAVCLWSVRPGGYSVKCWEGLFHRDTETGPLP